MDITSLSLYRELCCTGESERKLFDLTFQKYVVRDESGCFRAAMDAVVDNGWMPATSMVTVYGIMFPSSHFDENEDEDLMLALSVALLAKEMSLIGRG
jgi:hypothetical protein